MTYPQFPTTEWTLSDWLEAVDAPSIAQLIQFGEAADILGYGDWKEQTISGWKKGGIPKREDALDMIKVLSEIATRNHCTVLSTKHLREHAQIFMASKACKVQTGLTAKELEGLLQESAEDEADELDLIDHVYPPPPIHLFGRQETKKRALAYLSRYPVVQITAVGGEGKTALAWHLASEVRQSGLCTSFDWTTDKRSYIRTDGSFKETNEDPLNFSRLLRSMVARFGWRDLEGESEKRLERRCAEKLRNGKHLIVVDNLETVEDADYIVKHLIAMLSWGRHEASSRALLTTRVAIQEAGCVQLDIGGIESDDWQAYVHSVQAHLGVQADLLSDKDCERLGKATGGNPLFMRIALQRYALAPNSLDNILQDIDMGQHFKTFATLFTPLRDKLDEDALWLAQYASARPTILDTKLQDQWNIEYDLAYPSGSPEEKISSFFNALALLRQYRVLDPVGTRGEYSMHPLVRAYFKRMPA